MKLLIVDDDIALHRAMEKALQVAKPLWHATFSNNGENALSILAAEPFDVLITDMVMPIMDGPKLLTAVSRDYPTMLKVVMSGVHDSLTTYSITSCSHLFIEKPFSIEAFVNLVETALIEHNHEVKRTIAWREDEEARKLRLQERLKRLGVADVYDK
tara:strand:+ start:257 stop:727 length:471 start_codon:yes stop_codon:yes gene_type:complete